LKEQGKTSFTMPTTRIKPGSLFRDFVTCVGLAMIGKGISKKSEADTFIPIARYC